MVNGRPFWLLDDISKQRVVKTLASQEYAVAPAADLEREQALMDAWFVRYGTPTELFDMSVDQFVARRLSQSALVGIVDIHLDETSPVIHPDFTQALEERLTGRAPHVTIHDQMISADFRVKDRSTKTKLLVIRFGYTAAFLTGGVAKTYTSGYDPSPDSPKTSS